MDSSQAHAFAHLDEEQAGCRGRVMVDVDGDQHACDHDEHHQQDAQDQTGVKRVCSWHSVYSAVSRHHCKTTQKQTLSYFR